jgi:hypothetical protein
MKTLIASALLASLAAVGVASANPVATGPLAAIAHFNMDREGGNRIETRTLDTVSVSTRADVAGAAYARFNRDADSQDGIRGTQGATLVSGSPAFGADVFAAIRAANAEND